jgi:hypothetical protein
MKGKLIGYYRKFGVFTPKDSTDEMKFDNVVLQFSTELELGSKNNVTLEGKPLKFSEMKFKIGQFYDYVDLPINRLSELDDFIGKEFEWFYNEYGKPEKVVLV